MLKELKEDRDKVKKTMYKQNENINNETEIKKELKRNPEPETYNN